MSSLKLIAMLTWHDVTVPDAKEVFLSAKDAPTDYWGFKVTGTTPESMRELIKCMKDAGKRTFIEELAIDEESCLRTAEICAECGVDHLLGTVYFDSVYNVAKSAGMAYSPFAALDADSRLTGTIPSVIERADELEKKDIFGISLSGFRYRSGDPYELIEKLTPTLKKPMTLMGSVNSYERIEFLKKQPNLMAFTIGGAFFEHKFGDTFASQIEAVVNCLNK